MIIKNLTPHNINVMTNNGTMITFTSDGVARAEQKSVKVDEIDGIAIMETEFGAPVDLPDFEEGVLLIVSLATANAAKKYGRRTDDLLLTNGVIRDENQVIIGCQALARI